MVRNQLFICYSHKDSKWLEMLHTSLKPLLPDIACWDDTHIQAGEVWRRELGTALASTKVAVLLVSPNFLASDFILEQELPLLLNAAKNGELVIFWIAIRNCLYQFTAIERYQALNDPSTPLASLGRSARDDELVRIGKQIQAAFSRGHEQKKQEEANVTLVDEVAAKINLNGISIVDRTSVQNLIQAYFDVSACFVRQQELQQLLELVRHGFPVILQGPHGSGKTVLLKRLQVLCEHEAISTRYVDLGTRDAQFQSTLWRNVVLSLTNSDPGIFKPEEIEEYLETVVQNALVCLDNADTLARNPRISFEREMIHMRALVHWIKMHHSQSAFSVMLTVNDGFNTGDYNSGFGSPWFTVYLRLTLAELSEQRAIQLLKHAGITDEAQLAFCVSNARQVVPLDLLLLAYLIKEYSPSGSPGYELIEKMYLQIEPLLRM